MLKIGRGAHASPFLVMDVIAAANRRQAALAPDAPHIIRMEVGQPGTGAPAGAVRAAQAALTAGQTLGYTEALGNPGLRARIAAHYQDWYKEAVDPRRIAITTGASGGFPLAFLAAFDPGDRVALAAPYYPPYVNILRALGLEPVILPASEDHRFQPTPALLDRLDPPPSGLILASPANPTGTMLHPHEFAALAAWCQSHGVRMISDEIYHGLTWGTVASTAANLPGAIVINSFSKYFSMTGWRVGWMVMPEELIRPIECLAQNFFISAPHISQVAAEAAFDCAFELNENLLRIRRARAQLVLNLPAAGFPDIAPPQGAFYIFADIRERSHDSVAFCARMLEEVGVAASPGVDFDPDRGGHFVRFSYCGPEADMVAACQRLKQFKAGWDVPSPPDPPSLFA
jgi:aspartate/methionine/tyrosine aminotransferase